MILKKCRQNLVDCAFRTGDNNIRCLILDDTRFEKVCPFYKTRATLMEQDPEYFNRGEDVLGKLMQELS